MTFPEYMKYINFTCDEELDRMHEFLYCLDNNFDQSENSYYIAYPESNCPPNKEDVEKALAGRDFALDFAIIDGDSEADKEELYTHLRQLILYS